MTRLVIYPPKEIYETIIRLANVEGRSVSNMAMQFLILGVQQRRMATPGAPRVGLPVQPIGSKQQLPVRPATAPQPRVIDDGETIDWGGEAAKMLGIDPKTVDRG